MVDTRIHAARENDLSDGRLMQIFLDLRPALTAFASARLPSPSEIDDVLQDVAARLMSRRGEPVENMTGFIFAVVSATIKDRYRRSAARHEKAHVPIYDLSLVAEQPTAEAALESRQRLERLARAIDRLPDEIRETFKLHRLNGLSVKEAADRQGLPVHRVYSNIEKALARLSRQMTDD